MKKLLIGICLALLWPVAVQANSVWGKCGAASVATASTVGADRRIGPNESECFYFNADETSDVFFVSASSARISLDPDVSTDGAATAKIMVRACEWGTTTYSANRCVPILDTALDGSGGGPATQNASARVGPGAYVIVNVTSAATDEAVVVVRGE